MTLSTPSSNIINQLLNNNTILYNGSKNIYSLFLKEYSSYNIISSIDQPIIGIINDNIINYSQEIESLSLQNHVYSIVLFHSYCPAALKKEDRYILYQKIKSAYKIFFSEEIYQSWSLQEDDLSHTIPYGTITHQNNYSKNIVVLNLEKNSIITNIYKQLAESFTDVIMVDGISDYSDLIQILSNYKVSISLGDQYSNIVSAGCGCFVVTDTIKTPYINNIYTIKSIEEIYTQTASILKNFDSQNILNNIDYINKKYNKDEHLTKIENIFNLLNTRIFTL